MSKKRSVYPLTLSDPPDSASGDPAVRRRCRHRPHHEPGKPPWTVTPLAATLLLAALLTAAPGAAASGEEAGPPVDELRAELAAMRRDYEARIAALEARISELELWAPVLVDKSGNRRIREGEPGYVGASQGVPLLDVPTSLDRSAGDVHVYGNPHVFTSPLNAKIVVAAVAAGLARVDPAGAATYQANLTAFDRRIDEALYGKALVDLLGAETLDPLARSGKLIPFLRGEEYQGEKLIDLLGGWLGQGMVFRGEKIVTYHGNWIYFTDLFGLQVVDYVEPKPGIPPSARHVRELIDEIRRQGVKVVLAANYFSARQVDQIAERTGCTAVIVPLGPGGAADYFALVDLWVSRLARAYAGA